MFCVYFWECRSPWVTITSHLIMSISFAGYNHYTMKFQVFVSPSSILWFYNNGGSKIVSSQPETTILIIYQPMTFFFEFRVSWISKLWTSNQERSRNGVIDSVATDVWKKFIYTHIPALFSSQSDSAQLCFISAECEPTRIQSSIISGKYIHLG